MRKLFPFILLSAFTFAGAAQQPSERGGAAPEAPAAPRSMEGMQGMQGRMQQMRDLMARIHETADPAERQRLMDEHMRTMHESMQMMGRGMGQPPTACTEGDARCEMQRMQGAQQMMQQRMDMMQGMMGQMMEHMMQQGAAGPSAAPRDEAAPANHEAHH